MSQLPHPAPSPQSHPDRTPGSESHQRWIRWLAGAGLTAGLVACVPLVLMVLAELDRGPEAEMAGIGYFFAAIVAVPVLACLAFTGIGFALRRRAQVAALVLTALGLCGQGFLLLGFLNWIVR